MGFDQYHEPPEELTGQTRTFVHIIQSMIEEAEAISWYEQRLAVELNEEARAIMTRTQEEEFIHFGMDLEFLLRQTPKWRTTLKKLLFTENDVTELAEKAEDVIPEL